MYYLTFNQASSYTTLCNFFRTPTRSAYIRGDFRDVSVTNAPCIYSLFETILGCLHLDNPEIEPVNLLVMF